MRSRTLSGACHLAAMGGALVGVFLVLVAAVMAADPEPRRAIDSGRDDVADMLREMTPIRVCWLDDSGPVQLYRIHADHLETLPGAEGETIAEATDGLPDEPIYTDSPLLPVMPCPDRPIRAPGDMDGAP